MRLERGNGTSEVVDVFLSRLSSLRGRRGGSSVRTVCACRVSVGREAFFGKFFAHHLLNGLSHTFANLGVRLVARLIWSR